MTDFYIKAGDTSPALEYKLSPPVNLSGASVVFTCRRIHDGEPLVHRQPAEIVDEEIGIVRFDWPATITDPCRAAGEFEITYADGAVETFPNHTYIEVEITDDLG